MKLGGYPIIFLFVEQQRNSYLIFLLDALFFSQFRRYMAQMNFRSQNFEPGTLKFLSFTSSQLV